jgi:hypothetical protein
VLGLRVLRHVEAAGTIVDVQGGVGRVVQRAYVDYSWTANVDLVVRRNLNPRVGVYAHGLGELYGVDAALSNRGTQPDGRLEAGIRINGTAGALELFAGVERRVDANPIDLQSQRWALAGFRLVSK